MAEYKALLAAAMTRLTSADLLKKMAEQADTYKANGWEYDETLVRAAADEIERLHKVEAAARELMDNSPIGDDDKPYCSDVAQSEFNALYLSLQPLT